MHVACIDRNTWRCAGVATRADASGVERLSLAVEHDGQDLGIAAQSAHRGDRQRSAVVGLAHGSGVQTRTQRVEVDEHRDRWNPLRSLAATDGSDQGLDLELIPRRLTVGGLPAELGAAVGDRRPEGTIADGIERDQRLAHARRAVCPALDLRRLAVDAATRRRPTFPARRR